MAAITDPLAFLGGRARAKLILLGSSDFPSENLMNRVRSLNLEHVSPAKVMRSEISRRPASAVAEEAATLAAMRKWFFTRKPDAGFVLTDFPATLLQAKVFDEWLDARDESVDGILAGPASPEVVLEHYRTLGLFIQTSDFAA